MSLSLSPTLELHNHHAQDTDASMCVAFNKDGCCSKHQDILLRQRKILGGWKVLLPECPRCAIEWRTKQDDSQSRLDEVYSNIRQLQDDERNKAEMHFKQMSESDGNKEALVKVLKNRVLELQEENQALLKEVDHLKSEIIASNLNQAEKVKALTDERNQLVNESEALVDSSFSSIQNAVSELSMRMNVMNQALQTKQQDVMNLAITDNQSLPVDTMTTTFSSVKPNTSLLLPIEIKLCNVELESARVTYLQAIDRNTEAKAEQHAEEVKLEELFRSMIPDSSEVAEKITKVKMDINKLGTVSSPNFNALKDATLEAKASADLLKGCKLRLKQLQTQHFVLHKQCDLTFSSIDINFVAYTIRELKYAGYSAKELKDAGYIISELKDAGFSAKELKDLGVTAKELKDAGYAAYALKNAGYNTAKELKEAGFTAKELKDSHNTAKELKDAGYTAKEFKDTGYTAKELKDTGFNIRELKEAGYTVKELKDTGYSIQDFRNARYAGWDLKNSGSKCDIIKEFKDAGFTAKDLKDVLNFTAKDLKNAGYPDYELKNAGFSTYDLQNAGCSF